MKQVIITICTLLAFGPSVFGQDIIIKNDKTEIKAKVIEIQEEFIRYYLFDQQNGPIRNIGIKDVFMVIYEDGAREVFKTTPITENRLSETTENQGSVQANQPYSQVIEQPAIESNEPVKWGFVFGGKAGYYIPYNQDISEIYGGGFMGGLILGYWGKGAGIELDWRFYSKNGTPYTYNTDNADCKIMISPLTLTGYWDAYHRGNFSTYVGIGIGACFIQEDLIMSAYGQTASASESLTGFEYHTTGGIRFAPFYLEITFSSCTVNEISFGGIIIGGGLFF